MLLKKITASSDESWLVFSSANCSYIFWLRFIKEVEKSKQNILQTKGTNIFSKHILLFLQFLLPSRLTFFIRYYKKQIGT